MVPWALDVVPAGAHVTHVDGTLETAEAGERRKDVLYADCLTRTPGVEMVPFEIDSFGGLGPAARILLGTLVQRMMVHMRRVEDEEVDTRLRYLYTQRVVLALLRAQAHVVRRRCKQRAPAGWQTVLGRTLRADHALARAAALDDEPDDPVGQADLAIVDVPLMAFG